MHLEAAVVEQGGRAQRMEVFKKKIKIYFFV
jgi:hypothetical protein